MYSSVWNRLLLVTLERNWALVSLGRSLHFLTGRTALDIVHHVIKKSGPKVHLKQSRLSLISSRMTSKRVRAVRCLQQLPLDGLRGEEQDGRVGVLPVQGLVEEHMIGAQEAPGRVHFHQLLVLGG